MRNITNPFNMSKFIMRSVLKNSRHKFRSCALFTSAISYYDTKFSRVLHRFGFKFPYLNPITFI